MLANNGTGHARAGDVGWIAAIRSACHGARKTAYGQKTRPNRN